MEPLHLRIRAVLGGFLLSLLLARTVRRRKPDLVVGGEASPFLLRWRLLPHNRVFNIYLHRFMRDDDERALHDHPWPSVSFILAGGYWEYLPRDGGREFMPGSTLHPAGALVALWRAPGAIVFRRPITAHRIAIPTDRQVWTLFIVGPRVRDWGFRCPQGFVPWRHYTKNNGAEIGKGCDQ